MKMFKRNAIIITVVLFVCVAVYLNWSYNKKNTILDSDPYNLSEQAGFTNNEENKSEIGLFYEGDELNEATESGVNGTGMNVSGLNEEVSDYFAEARLTRQQARAYAITTLKEASDVETASQEVKDQAAGEIAVMANYSLAEAEIETLIRAKGFAECVVFLKEDSAIVAVPAPQEGLSVSSVSRILEIVLSETELVTEQVKIIEVK